MSSNGWTGEPGIKNQAHAKRKNLAMIKRLVGEDCWVSINERDSYFVFIRDTQREPILISLRDISRSVVLTEKQFYKLFCDSEGAPINEGQAYQKIKDRLYLKIISVEQKMQLENELPLVDKPIIKFKM